MRRTARPLCIVAVVLTFALPAAGQIIICPGPAGGGAPALLKPRPAKPKPEEIPLAKIWTLDQPGTRRLPEDLPQAGRDEARTLLPLVMRRLHERSEASGRPTAFLTAGDGSLVALHRRLERSEGADSNTWRTGMLSSVVFYACDVSQYIRVGKVTRTDEEIVIEYKAVAHRSREITSHLALVPIRLTRDGNVTVTVRPEGKVHPGVARRVSAGFTVRGKAPRSTDFAKSTTRPGGAGWQARLVALETAYELDLGLGNRIEEYRRALKPAPGRLPRPVGKAPEAPRVWLDLEIRNNSKSARTFYFGNDASKVMLELAGPGAETITPMIAMTMEFRMGKPVRLEAGQTHRIPIRSLAFGQRGVSKRAYWTQAGSYKLSATYHMVAEQGGGGRVEITTAPVELSVFDPTPDAAEGARRGKAMEGATAPAP